jgi:hypothetical protein
MFRPLMILLTFFWHTVCFDTSPVDQAEDIPVCSCSRNLNRDVDVSSPTSPLSSLFASSTHESCNEVNNPDADIERNGPDVNPMVFVEGGMLIMGIQKPLIPQV